MRSRRVKLLFLIVLLMGASLNIAAQTDASNRPWPPRRPLEEQLPLPMREALAKKKASQEQREHEEMVERGKEALKLADELDKAFEEKQTLSAADRKKLDQLEKLVTRIRKDLGGDYVDEEDAAEEEKPSTMREAFSFLKSTTGNLVEELGKTSRFSISVVAIQSSNAVIRLARFLRLRK